MSELRREVLWGVGQSLAIIAGVTLAAGVSAPHWPRRWLTADRGPLRLTRCETLERYRRVARWRHRLPEATPFGGPSKSRLPGRSGPALADHAVELRRGEWVHWISASSAIALPAVRPRWLGAVFALATLAVNVPFLLVLRGGRLRLGHLVALRERR